MQNVNPQTSERIKAPDRGVAIAFLVDGDNASSDLIAEMLAEVSKYGTVIVKRVYGDWSAPRMAGWRSVHQQHSLIPIQQFAHVAGKNATDTALVIDAMDFLHGGTVQGFCIVSSDSDFTRLAMRIREKGLFVMGIGEEKTHEALRRAYDVFVLAENLAPPDHATKAGKRPVPAAAFARRSPSEATELLTRAFETVVSEDGTAHLAAFGNALLKLDPAFDVRSYGRIKLLDLIQALPESFETHRPVNAPQATVLVRRAPPKR